MSDDLKREEAFIKRAKEKIKDFDIRNSQLEMMRKVYKALDNKKFLICEAPTGTGKSLAYLFAALEFLKKNKDEKILISTASITLQEQLIRKDIKMLKKLIDKNIKYTIVKGMNNYLCLKRFNELKESKSLLKTEREKINLINTWIGETKRGDREELNFVDENFWSEVNANKDFCVGKNCAFYDKCFFKNAKKIAAESQIIITNHHLLFSDLKIKNNILKHKIENLEIEEEEEILREEIKNLNLVLPFVKNLIIDEAHYIEEVLLSLFKTSLSKHSINILTSNISKIINKIKAQSANISKELMELRIAFENLEVEITKEILKKDEFFLIDKNSFAEESPYKKIVSSINDVEIAFKNLNLKVREIERGESDEEIKILLKKAVKNLEEKIILISYFSSKVNLNSKVAIWIERKQRFLTLSLAKLDIAEELHSILYSQMDSIIFTSATLRVSDNFKFFISKMGLERENIKYKVEEEKIKSLFNYKKQAILQVIKDISSSKNEAVFLKESLDYTKEFIKLNKGGTLILLTSFKALEFFSREMQTFSKEENLKLYTQGSLPKNLLLEKFKKSRKKAVLIGIKSFWQGIDIKGRGLTMVIIPKLPFAMPNDPIALRKSEILREEGKSPFYHESLPATIFQFKQGFGRLIRSREDFGIIVCFDKRLFTENYGQYFLKSLPGELEIKYSHLSEALENVENFLKVKV